MSTNAEAAAENQQHTQQLHQQHVFCHSSPMETQPTRMHPHLLTLRTTQCLSPMSNADVDTADTDGSPYQEGLNTTSQSCTDGAPSAQQQHGESTPSSPDHIDGMTGSLASEQVHHHESSPQGDIFPPSSSTTSRSDHTSVIVHPLPNGFPPLSNDSDTEALHPQIVLPTASNGSNVTMVDSNIDTPSPQLQHPQFVSNSPNPSLSPTPQTSPSLPHQSVSSLNTLHPAIGLHLPSASDLLSPQLSIPSISPNTAVALLNWQASQQQNSDQNHSLSVRGSRYTVKSAAKKKRVTIAGVDGGKYSLSGKRIGRPRVDRGNTRCHECDTVTTPQWRFLTHEELLTCPIPLRLPPLENNGTKLVGDPNSPDNNNGSSDPGVNANNSLNDGSSSSSSSSDWAAKDDVLQALRAATPGGTAKTGLQRKICLCNACWLRVHKAKQKLKNGGRVNIPSRRRSAVSEANLWYASPPSPLGPSTRLTSVLEELASKNGSLDHNLSVARHSTQALARTPLSPSLDSGPSSSAARSADVRVDASNAAASVIEAAATLAMRGNSAGDPSETIWLAPGLRYGGSLEGQPIIIMNGQDVLVLPSVHATASPGQRAHLQQAQQQIEQHILQHVSDQIRQAQHDELHQQQRQQREINQAFQMPQGELQAQLQQQQPESLELSNQLQRQLLQHQLQQRQQFIDLLESSSVSAPSPIVSPFDSIFRLSSPTQSAPSSELSNSTTAQLMAQQSQQPHDRERRESLASLTAAAQEFLSASATASVQQPATTPLMPPVSPNTSNVMAQLDALTLSPLAGVSLDVLRSSPHGTSSPSQNNPPSQMMLSNGASAAPPITLQEWQPPASMAIDRHGAVSTESSQPLPNMSDMSQTPTSSENQLSIPSGPSCIPSPDQISKLQQGRFNGSQSLDAEMPAGSQQTSIPEHSGDSKVDDSTSYSDAFQRPSNNNGPMFSETCGGGHSDVHSLRPMLTNHWLFY